MEKNERLASNSYTPPFMSSNPERQPLVGKNTPFSIVTRTLLSGYTSHPFLQLPETAANNPSKSRESTRFVTRLKNISLQETPPSYLREIPEVDESSEEYVLVGRRWDGGPEKMDSELEKMKERDSKLKRNIRRFRFILRCAHLACRLSTRSLKRHI